MAAFDFPSSPSIGTVANGYAWDGEKWNNQGGGTIYISDTPPVAPAGSLWWESDSGTLYVRYNDGTSTQWVALLNGAGAPSAKKNYIINGAMMVSQENGSTAGSVSSYYPVDQFGFIFGNTGTQTIQQVANTTPGGSPNRIRVTTTVADASVAATDFCVLFQRIEGVRAADLRFGSPAAKTTVLQFGVKAPAGTYCISIENSATNRAYVAEYVITAGEANVDVIKSMVIPGDIAGTWLVDNGIGIAVNFCLMVGTTYQATAGSWGAVHVLGSPNQFNLIGANGNVFELFDVSLTEGYTAPPYIVPDFASELALCQRYWWKTFDYSIRPIQNSGSSSGALMVSTHGTSTFGGSMSFPVSMCKIPTILTFNPSAANANWRDGNNGGDRTFNSQGAVTSGAFLTGLAGIVNGLNFIHFTANARL